MTKDGDWENLGDLFGKTPTKKPPAFEWQELALKIMQELNIPPFKRSSIFKVCRDNHKETIERALADTKELCTSGEKWKYFLKIISEGKKS